MKEITIKNLQEGILKIDNTPNAIDKYFQKLNADEETDTFNIIYDFNRYKAKMYAIEVLLNIVIREFRENKLI